MLIGQGDILEFSMSGFCLRLMLFAARVKFIAIAMNVCLKARDSRANR
jgi:hypothetical protein